MASRPASARPSNLPSPYPSSPLILNSSPPSPGRLPSSSVRTIPAGAVVGYNGTFVATEPMRLALIAAGYADGLDRSLGNRFSLLVQGERAPLVGRISMDHAVLDVTEIPGVETGDEVVILGIAGRRDSLRLRPRRRHRNHSLGSLHPHRRPCPPHRRLRKLSGSKEVQVPHPSCVLCRMDGIDKTPSPLFGL